MKKSISKLLVCTMICSFLLPAGSAFAGICFSPQKLQLNGTPVRDIPVYNISGQNYFRLKDLAYYLDYELEYDDKARAVLLWKGGEGTKPEPFKGKPPKAPSFVSSSQPVYIDGTDCSDRLKAVNIGGYNYFKLRDLAKAADFGLSYNEATNTVMVSSNHRYDEKGLVKEALLPADWKDLLRGSLAVDKEYLAGILHKDEATKQYRMDSVSVALRAPETDWWMNQSEEIKALTDRDTFNLCVSILKDRENLDTSMQNALDQKTCVGRTDQTGTSSFLFSPDYVYPYVKKTTTEQSELMENVLYALLPNQTTEVLYFSDTGRIAELPEYYNPDALDGDIILMARSNGLKDPYTLDAFTNHEPGYKSLEKFITNKKPLNDQEKYIEIYRYVTDRFKPGSAYLDPKTALKDHDRALAVTKETYSGVFYELARLLDLPVITLGGENESLNLVCVEGDWYYTNAYSENATGIFLPITALKDPNHPIGRNLDQAKDLAVVLDAITHAAESR